MIFRDRGPTLEPVLLPVNDSRTHDRVEAELHKRYGADYQVVKPGPPPDEHFHRFVSEQLDEWGRSNLPGLKVACGLRVQS